MKGMEFFKILIILSISSMVITKDDDNKKKDPGTKEKEEDKKIDKKHYEDMGDDLKKEIKELEDKESSLNKKIKDEKAKKGGGDKKKIAEFEKELKTATTAMEEKEIDLKDFVKPRLKFINQHDNYMREMKDVEDQLAELSEDDEQKAEKAKLEKIVADANTEMDEIYHPIKYLMINETKIMKNVTIQKKKLDSFNEDEDDNKENTIKTIEELEDKLSPISKEIDAKLKNMTTIYHDYKTRPRLQAKREKFVIDEKVLKAKYDKFKKTDNETAKEISKLELFLKREKIITVDWELKDVMLEDELTVVKNNCSKDIEKLQEMVDKLEGKDENCNNGDQKNDKTDPTKGTNTGSTTGKPGDDDKDKDKNKSKENTDDKGKENTEDKGKGNDDKDENTKCECDSGNLSSAMNFDLIPMIVPYLLFMLNF